MYAGNALVVLVAAGAASASIIAERVPFGAISARSVTQGWSLQASSAPDGTTSCGGGSYCPSSLQCNPAANDEVAACCSNDDCRGAVEGAPVCADSSWSLWKGLNGNGFCCTVGMVGVYDYHSPVAGTCVSSAAAAGATTAIIMSTGSGSAPATSGSPASSTASPATAIAPASGSAATASSGASSVAGSATATIPVSSAGSTSTSTTSATVAKTTSGAEKLAGGFSVVAFVLMAMLAL